MSEIGVGSGGGDKAVVSSARNWLIGGLLAVGAAIIFGLLYLFVIAPAVPDGSVGWYLFAFATGLTMIVMPCTLPLAFVIVPLSMGKGMIKGISMALAFGVGVAFTLSIYGIAAALLGGLALGTLGTNLETLKNWVYFGAGIFALIFALSEIGLMKFHMPTYSGAAPAFIQKRREVFKAFLLGAFLGNVGVGCPHPATPLLLIEVATSSDVLYGWTMFLIHAIGRVLPLLLLAFLAILGVNGLNWLMARKDAVERGTGWAMVFVAGFILTLGLFSHKWWVNSGIHSGLEVLTQESAINSVLNKNFETEVAHAHGIEAGAGLFNLPLEWGSWFLVFLWLFPIWWWYAKRRRQMHNSPAFKIRELEAQIDRLERDRRQIETMLNVDELETTFDLKHAQEEIDALEATRREEESKIQYGETGVYKEPVARKYEEKIMGLQRNYLIAISLFLILIFVYYIPTNFALKNAPMEGMMGSMPHTTAPSAPTSASDETQGTPFDTSIANLPEAKGLQFVELKNGDTYMMTASYVQKKVGNRTLRMLAYNGSIPGPFIKVQEGSQITIIFVNNTDTDQTIHSHGLRLNNNFDGVPEQTQNAVKPGETFTYTLDFPDAGIAWYHPHTRDDYGQEMGLYGNYFVDPTDPLYYNKVNREVPLVIDDILIEDDRIAPFYKEYTDHALLGRFGNQYLVNGEIDYTLQVQKGEVIRFLMTNVSNARTYRLSIPGALIKRVAADLGKFEMETFTDELIISPAERLVFEVYFPEVGTYKLVNRTDTAAEEIVRFVGGDPEVENSYRETFLTARKDFELTEQFTAFRSYFDRAPDKKLKLTVALGGNVEHDAHAHAEARQTPAGDSDEHGHGAPTDANVDHNAMMAGTNQMMTAPTIGSIQWSDPTNSDAVNTTKNVEWLIVDETTGKKSMDIPVSDWTFTQGSLVKVRITNDMMAAHVMQHPIHIHGQRFLVLSENGVINNNMAWKDTAMVLPGGYIDVLIEMSNLGEWMLHCHISEHLHAGMMMPFRVEDQNGYATGDEFRNAKKPSSAIQSNTNAPQPTVVTAFTYETVVNDTNQITLDKPRYKVNTPEYVAFSFKDKAGTPISLDKNRQAPLTVTFVSRNGKDHFTTYPGNTGIHMRTDMNNTNTPGTPEFNESMPHGHSFNFPSLVEKAYAEVGAAGHGHDGTAPVDFVPTYSVPAYFSEQGEYRAFVEYYLEGESAPWVGSLKFTVGSAAFSVNDLGWSPREKWWYLFIISLILIAPLTYAVNRYINVKK